MAIVKNKEKRNCFAACPQSVINAGRCICNNQPIHVKETSKKSEKANGLKETL